MLAAATSTAHLKQLALQTVRGVRAAKSGASQSHRTLTSLGARQLGNERDGFLPVLGVLKGL